MPSCAASDRRSERELVRVDRVEGAVVQGRLEVDHGIARERGPWRPHRGRPSRRPGRTLRARSRRRPARRTRRRRPGWARSRARRGRTGRGRRSASCAGPRPGSCRGSSRDRGPAAKGHDRGAEFALEALDDDRDVGLALRPRSCSPVSAGARHGRRVLLEQALERGAHLVQVGLGLRLDGDRQRGLREVDRGQRRTASRAAKRVAGVGRRAWRPRRSRPPISPTGSWSLPCSEQQLADALFLAALGVPHVIVGVDLAAEDAEVGQPADERVGRGLEDLRRAADRCGPARPRLRAGLAVGA